MPIAIVRGAALNHEIIGTHGPAMALTPGGRNPLGHIRSLAERMAAAGYRVLIHDRRNCGASDVGFDPAQSEFEGQADDLHALLARYDMLPAIIGGASSGARLSLAFALRHPAAVRALVLWRVTGGRFAVERLVEKYYDEYIRAAEQGGMAAVAATEHFAEIVRNRPSNRERLLAIDPGAFIAVMQAWRAHFVASVDWPLIGVSERDLGSIVVPACLVPGDDRIHGEETGVAAARLIPDCELHLMTSGTRNIEMADLAEWDAREEAMATLFADFLARKLALRRAG